MERDPILQEIHAQKKQMAAEASFDLHILCEKLRENESQQTSRLAKIQPYIPEKDVISLSK